MARPMRTPEASFPLDARTLLPHEGPMCCIDRLLSSSKTSAASEAYLHPAHSLLTDGALDPAGYVELAAQTAGAMQGYDQFMRGLPPKSGFLVGVQDFVIHGVARAGEMVRMNVSVIAELGEVTVLAAEVLRGETLLAEGRLKVFIPE